MPFLVAELGPDVDPFVLHLFAVLAEKETRSSPRYPAGTFGCEGSRVTLGCPLLHVARKSAVDAVKSEADRYYAANVLRRCLTLDLVAAGRSKACSASPVMDLCSKAHCERPCASRPPSRPSLLLAGTFARGFCLFHPFRHLSFDCVKIKARASLHRWEVEERLEFFAY
jgi:hypothetical protein